jgi:titin
LGNGFAPSAIFLGQPINGTDGLTVCSGPNTIGGTAAGAGNVISGNAGNGVSLVSDGNVVQGNVVGANIWGTAAISNGVDGIGFAAAPLAGTGFCLQAPQSGGNDNTIGGTAPGAGNLIGGNTATGIEIVQGTGNVVQGNRIGVNAALTGTLPNGGDGVSLGGACNDGVCHGSSDNTIAGNVVGGNGGDGIHLDGLGNGVGNVVQGNAVGAGASGASLGNAGNGVFAGDGAVDDAIGGTTAGAGNVIAHNGGAGVLIGTGTADTGTHSAVQRNAIFANGGLGIDLAPQGTVNCATAPPGPNDYTPCPTIAHATTTAVSGAACVGCAVEVYRASVEADDQGHGEGQAFLGSVTAGANGAWSLALTAGQVAAGQQVTASATTPVGFQTAAETSEFAANATVSS